MVLWLGCAFVSRNACDGDKLCSDLDRRPLKRGVGIHRDVATEGHHVHRYGALSRQEDRLAHVGRGAAAAEPDGYTGTEDCH